MKRTVLLFLLCLTLGVSVGVIILLAWDHEHFRTFASISIIAALLAILIVYNDPDTGHVSRLSVRRHPSTPPPPASPLS